MPRYGIEAVSYLLPKGGGQGKNKKQKKKGLEDEQEESPFELDETGHCVRYVGFPGAATAVAETDVFSVRVFDRVQVRIVVEERAHFREVCSCVFQ